MSFILVKQYMLAFLVQEGRRRTGWWRLEEDISALGLFIVRHSLFFTPNQFFWERHTWYKYTQGLRMGIAGAQASGWAGQHLELFDSILGGVKNVTTHNHSQRVQYVR